MFSLPITWSAPLLEAVALVFYVLLAGSVTVDILLKKNDVPRALGWIGLVWLTPIFGGLLYYLGGPRGALRRRRFWVASLPVAAAAVAARLTNEEAALAGHFGAAWRAHAARRWRLVPLLF